jgi:hypothetical protein
MLTIFFNSKGIVHKEFILAGQIVNSTYYCDVLWPPLWRQKNWLLNHDNTKFFTSKFLTKNNNTQAMSVASYS